MKAVFALTPGTINQGTMTEKTLFSRDLTADEVRSLIAKGADPNEHEEMNGDTPLMRESSGEVVRALIEGGADVHAVNDFGHNVLHCAAFLQDPDVDYMKAVIDEACKAGLSLDGPENVDAPLFLAVYSDAEATVEYLLERGANPNAGAVKDGIVTEPCTALDYAATVSRNTINTLMLLQAGACDEEVNASWTPLHRAAAAGHTEEVAALLSAGMEADTRGILECTPLMVASMSGHTAVVKQLLAAGADIEAHNLPEFEWEEPFVNYTALQLASWKGQNDVVRCLLEYGANPDTPGSRKLTALHEAVMRGHVDTVRLLLESGANPNIIAGENEDDFNEPPLYFARKNSEIFQLLLQYGATPL